jgi:cellulose synthase (UDP-forming)
MLINDQARNPKMRVYLNGPVRSASEMSKVIQGELFRYQGSARSVSEGRRTKLLYGSVVLGIIALLYYYSWWFTGRCFVSPWLAVALLPTIFWSGTQLLGPWLLYLIARRPSVPPPLPDGLTVDVFVTACGESRALIERTLAAACAMRGNHLTWLLDDGADPALTHSAKRLGAGYLTRTDRTDAKAGNINAALSRTDGDIVVIFDVDHTPAPNFLERTLGHFADPTIGFVQVMLTFCNGRQNWMAQAAVESSLDFYNPTSIGAGEISSATLMGSNALIRRTALDSIGGYQPGLAEDLATSIAIHAAGWRSAYTAEPLAPGLAPPDLAAWFTQQFKWARGVFEVLLTAYPRFFARLTWGQRLSYAVRMTKYWIGPVAGIHLFVTLAVLLGGSSVAWLGFQQYLGHIFPLALSTLLIQHVALRTWRHSSVRAGSLVKAIVLVYTTWPIYTLAWVMALLRLPLAFRPTPKSLTGALNPLWLLPQAMTLLLLVGGVFYSLTVVEEYRYFLFFCFAVSQGVLQIGLLWKCLHPGTAFKQKSYGF